MANQAYTRDEKRRWRRLSRARHTSNLSRGVIHDASPPRGLGPAIGIWDDDESGYPPDIIYAPRFRAAADRVDVIDLSAEGS